jgi:ribulose-phosphate 3-epimerase
MTAVRIAASVLAADFTRLGEEVRAVDTAGADWIHVDIMVVEPERSLERYRDAGANHLLIQAEPGSTVHLHRVLSQVRELGCRPGVVIDPATPIPWIEHVLHLVDIVLVMTVNPGFGGQAFLPEMLPKIAALRTLCNERGLHPHIEVDGGQDPQTVRQTVEAGADIIVAGTAIFGATDYTSAIANIRTAAQ